MSDVTLCGASYYEQKYYFNPEFDKLPMQIKEELQIMALVSEVVEPEAKVGLIGHFKDESSYYLTLFPEWEMVELDSLVGAISATPLREAYYRGEVVESAFPLGTSEFLHKFKNNEIYQQLVNKFELNDKTNLG